MLDTDICSYIIKQRPISVLERFEAVSVEKIGISVIRCCPSTALMDLLLGYSLFNLLILLALLFKVTPLQARLVKSMSYRKRIFIKATEGQYLIFLSNSYLRSNTKANINCRRVFMVEKKAWGLHTVIDLYSCDISLMTDKDHIENFIIELCKRIGMKRYGDVQIVYFGDEPEVSGYSMTQLIETSLISGHFADKHRAVFLDIFSCASYNPDEVVRFCVESFRANDYDMEIIKRGKKI
jgi:S-adenosylmethionine/arginine decarboxylase-like enzyme